VAITVPEEFGWTSPSAGIPFVIHVPLLTDRDRLVAPATQGEVVRVGGKVFVDETLTRYRLVSLGPAVWTPDSEDSTPAAVDVAYVPTMPGNWVDPDPTNVQGALDQLASRPEPQSFVFRPGGATAANVYADFTLLWAAVQNVEGKRTIVVDGSLTGNAATIPAGAYDFDGGLINIEVAPQSQTLNFADGATISNKPRISGVSGQQFTLTSLSTAPVMTSPVFDELFLSNCLVRAEGGAPFIEVTAGFQTIFLKGVSTNFANALQALWEIAAGASGTVLIASGAVFGNRTAIGLGTLLIFPQESSASFNPDDPAQLFAGTVNVFYGGLAARVGFTPTTPGAWTDPDPVNVQEALDQLAAQPEPASPSLTIVTTQQELDDAINAIPNQFVGHHVIEVRTSGLAINRSNFPQPQFGSIGHLDIIADRSAPVVTNAVPAFVADPNFATQFEDPNFGLHAGITAGDFWLEEDVSAFGAPYTTYYPNIIPSVSPAIRIADRFALFGGTASVYPRTIILNFVGPPVPNSPYLDGGNRTNRWGLGVRIIGFEANFGVGTARMVGVTFLACDYRGFGRFEDCLLHGHVGATGANQIVATFSSAKISGEVARIEGLHAAGGTVQVRGPGRIGNNFCEVPVTLDYGCLLGFVGDMDFRVVGGACFRYAGENSINLANSDYTLGTQATAFVAPSVGLDYLPGIAVFFDPGATVTGTVVDAFVLQNGSSLINADDACEGTLAATGDEVLLDGAPLTYLDSVAGVFSLDTGSFMGS